MMVNSPVADLSMIESYSKMVKKHQSMIAWGTMNLSPGRSVEVYVADLFSNQFFITNNMVFAYVSKTQDYIGQPGREEPSPKQQKGNGPGPKLHGLRPDPCKVATEKLKRKSTRSSMNSLESDMIAFIANKLLVNAVQ